MHIRYLRLHSRDLAAQRAFFGTTLGLPVSEPAPDQLAVQVGTTMLVFEHQPAWQGIYHYAFNIPHDRFADARAWLDGRADLIPDPNGEKEFFFETWNADALYFEDADGNIGELIARHTLDNTAGGAFGSDSLLNVSEIGWVVSDVLASAAHLNEAYSLPPYLGHQSEVFTAVGDADGLFILVPKRHPWLPDLRPAETGWFAATIDTPTGQHVFSPPV